jgi:hypothetical protein
VKPRIRWFLLGCLFFLPVGIGVNCWLTPSTPRDDFPETVNITYPYVATAERERQIVTEFEKIELKATVAQVTEKLGQPDIILPLYQPPVYRPKRIGFTYWYYVEKSSEQSIDGKGVRIAFDLDERVIGIDHWGFVKK